MNEMTHRPSIEAPQLRTLLLTDLCDSTSLVERIGDVAAATLFRDHDRLVLDLQQRWRGRLIDRSDGMLLLFERPIDGLGFALDYMRGLREMGTSRKLELKARAGLHVGEVLTWRNSEEAVQVGAKPLEVEGLAKPMAARLMAMARPGQILLSAVAEPLAHRAARELGERGQHLLWKSHGRWRFKGVPDSQQIYEVGEPGIAPLRVPPNSPKAWRDIPLWRRPAALAAEAAIIAGIGAGVWFATRPAPAIAFNQRDWVVVADLRNLTGQSVLDDSLEQAFRISLEQSRYVNVLSDLKVRETLGRMLRKPEASLDRATASEVALRDGARAVILPTVAEVGGRLRISAEVIDPHTQATIYSESNDGVGMGSALESIDDVTATLREHLGEALQSVERDSVPLPKVVTANLDALRAYSLGIRAYGNRQYEDARQYFAKATELDPDFALAYLGMVRIYVARGETALAQPLFLKAQRLRDKLPPRDALYLDAWAAEFGPKPSQSAPAKWKQLAGMYPDYFSGQANYAGAMFAIGDYDEALKSATAASAPQNPLRAISLTLAGRIHLARDEYKEALKDLRAAVTPQRPAGPQLAAALAATSEHAQAQRVLDALPADDIGRQLTQIATAVDQGQWIDARRASAQLKQIATNDSLAGLAKTIELSLLALEGGRALPEREYQRGLDGIVAGLRQRDATDQGDRLFFALSVAYLAQRAGYSGPAERALPELVSLSEKIASPRATELLQVVQANQMRLKGDAADAVSRLRPMLVGGELFQVHVALRDALIADGRHEDALRESRWITTHRGRAYGEWAGAFALQATNVADTTLARLEAAQLLQETGQVTEAQREIDAFRRAWDPSRLPAYLRRSLVATLPAS